MKCRMGTSTSWKLAPAGGTWILGTNFPEVMLVFNPKTLNLVEARLILPGVIVYEELKEKKQPQTVLFPQDLPDGVLKRLKKIINNYLENPNSYELQRELARFLQDNPKIKDGIIIGIETIAYSILLGTIVEDILTLGAGIADDPATILAAEYLLNAAKALRLAGI